MAKFFENCLVAKFKLITIMSKIPFGFVLIINTICMHFLIPKSKNFGLARVNVYGRNNVNSASFFKSLVLKCNTKQFLKEFHPQRFF